MTNMSQFRKNILLTKMTHATCLTHLNRWRLSFSVVALNVFQRPWPETTNLSILVVKPGQIIQLLSSE